MIRNENPRPYLLRENELLNLNGEWNFDFDDNNIGHKEKWFEKHYYSKKIEVPFPFQSKLSGIDDQTFHDHMWYNRTFKIKKKENKKYIITFNGVDYYSEVYINGYLVSIHKGASTIFKVDVTNYLNEEINEITLYVFDSSTEQDFPRGKQYWKVESESIFYTRTSGIYKNVYLEELANNYIDEYYIKSNIDKGEIEVETVSISPTSKIEYEVYLKGKLLNKEIIETNNKARVNNRIRVWDNEDINESYFHDEKMCWTPENPLLYDLVIKTYNENGDIEDNIKTYFAMRKIGSEKGTFMLNNRPFYQKLVLIQGYFKDGLLSYPSVEDLENDIKIAKDLGFNGGRIHQKVEDPYFYYLCDKSGFIAWLECPSAQIFNNKLVEVQTEEWVEIVKQNYNFPSIFVLVPLNESWGVPHLIADKNEVSFENGLYYLTKAIDRTRLVVSNDGWEMAHTDICSIHNYRHGEKNQLIQHERFENSLKNKDMLMNSTPANKLIFLNGYENKNIPFLLTEFGGISFLSKEKQGWGYTNVNSEEDFLNEYQRILTAIAKSEGLCGFCYTQLYDVEQEINGLLTYNRKPKTNPENIKKINDIVSKNIIYTK